MKRHVPHPCPGCGRSCWGRQCKSCYAASKPPPMARRADLDDYGQKKARRAAVARWRAENGDVCPGWQRPAHFAARLTADHPVEVALGGDPRPSEFVILCISCNSAKSNVRRAQARRSTNRAGSTPSRRWRAPPRVPAADRDW